MKIKLLHFMFEDLRRRSYIAALSALIYFFNLAVPAVFLLGEGRYSYSDEPAKTDMIIEYYENLFESAEATVSFLLLLVFVAVIVGFRYLMKQNQTDFYHSVPVSRKTVYLGVTINNLLMPLIPMVAFTFIAAGIATAKCVNMEPFMAAVHMLLTVIPKVVLICGIATISVHLAGNLFATVALNVYFHFYFVSLYFLVNFLYDNYYSTWFDRSEDFDSIVLFLCPFSYCVLPLRLLDTGMNLAIISAGALLLGTGLLVAAWLLYRIRILERAGRAIVFDRFQTILKFSIVIPMGIVGAMAGWETTSDMGLAVIGWTLFGLACGIVISHAILEIIFHSDFKKLFSHKLHMLICAVIAALVFSVFAFDLTGYNSYKPSAAFLKSAGIYCDELEPNMDELHRSYMLSDKRFTSSIDVDDRGRFSKKEYIDSMNITDKELIFAFADAAAESVKSRGGFRLEDKREPAQKSEMYVALYISYHMPAGRNVRRQYSVPFSKIKAGLEKLYDDPAYKSATYPVLEMKPEEVYGINFEDMFGCISLSCPRTSMEALLEAYKEDLLAMTAERRKHEDPVYCLKFNDKLSQELEDRCLEKGYESMGYYSTCGLYPVYPSFKNTIEALRTAGAPVDRSRTWNRFVRASIEYGANMSYATTSAEEITQLLNAGAVQSLTYKDKFSMKAIPLTVRLTPDYIEKSGKTLSDRSSGPLYLNLRTGEIPMFVYRRMGLLDMVIRKNSEGWDKDEYADMDSEL